MSEFGPVLRKFRKAAGFSQERLAKESGVSVEAIKTLEAGRRRYPWVQTVDLLSDGLGLDADERSELKAAAARPPVGTGPERLPAEVADFVGRAEQIATVSTLLTGGGQAPGVVVISAIAGMGGVGKTALAVRVARELAGRFADGVLYVNLRGFGVGEPMTPLEALSALLRQLGFVRQRPPGSVDEAAGLFRTACATRRLLVVLDNAATVEQVQPLLPGTANCAVIVTSRRALVGLPGAQPLTLDVLPEDEALSLLTSVAGRERIAADPPAARAVVELCGSLPLAIRIAGTRLAAEPAWTIADLARLLADETARLDELGDAEHGVRASIGLSLAGTSAGATEFFGPLGLHEGVELDLKVAARLVDRPEADVEPLLENLVDLHLLESVGPRRYQFHDLVRDYARELAPDDRTAAHRRVLDLYVAMAWQARTQFGFRVQPEDWFDEQWLRGTEGLEYDEVMSWLDVEADELLAAARRSMADPCPERTAVVRLAGGLLLFWATRRRRIEGTQLDELALAALSEDPTCAPPQATAAIRHHLGVHYLARADYETAAAHLRIAIDLDAERGYQAHRSLSLLELARCLERMDRLAEAVPLARTALDLARSVSDPTIEGGSHLLLGLLAGRLGHFPEQDESFALAVALVRRGGPRFLDILFPTIGESYLRSGRPEAARIWLRTHLPELKASTNRAATAEHLHHLATAELQLASYEAARQSLTDALTLVPTTNGELEARIRHSLGTALTGLGEPEPAREQWLLALELYRRYGLPQAAEVQALLGFDS
ncbi:NB-ARC domain-containing protein [Kribbella sp. NBC_01505]|uniref:NB-ARC domain-containing protein n=1 Tax=Kribbella sp. NBC_01505 TaxID=2903580 RepID=UPI00386388D3